MSPPGQAPEPVPFAVIVAADTATRRQVLAEAAALIEGAKVEHSPRPELLLRRLDYKDYGLVAVELAFAERTGINDLLLAASRAPGCAVVLVGDPAAPIAPATMRALQLGTAFFVESRPGLGPDAIDALAAGLARVARRVLSRRRAVGVEPARAALPRAPIAVPAHGASSDRRFWVAAIGVSTGGPEALSRVIPLLPADFPLPVLVVQHMPPVFTRTLADRLDSLSPLRVVEAQAGDAVVRGNVYVAPGGKHMIVTADRGQPVIGLTESPPVHSCRPAVDVLFESLAQVPEGRAVLAAVLTGMGYDGTAGVRALKAANARTQCLTQSESTCVVYGMPRAVDAAGLSDESVPLDKMAEALVQRVR